MNWTYSFFCCVPVVAGAAEHDLLVWACHPAGQILGQFCVKWGCLQCVSYMLWQLHMVLRSYLAALPVRF